MSLTLVLIVLCTSILVFFSQEFAGIIKKINTIPGVRVLAPLAFASWVVEQYHDWVLWGLLVIQNRLQRSVLLLATWLPFQIKAHEVAHILLLISLSLIPALLIHWYVLRKYERPFESPYLLSGIIWLCSVMLLCL